MVVKFRGAALLQYIKQAQCVYSFTHANIYIVILHTFWEIW